MVELYDPLSEIIPSHSEITQPVAHWLTPGMYLAQRIFDNPLVRFIGERYESEYLQTIVVLDDDPEETVDRIFEIEQKMFHKFGRTQFDIRVRVVPVDENIDLIKKSSIVHIDREIHKFNGGCY